MKQILLAACIIMLGSCHNAGSDHTQGPKLLAVNDDDQYNAPPAGTIVTADSMAVTNDPLNRFNFSVIIKANEYSNRGTYAIEAAYGPNTAEGMFTMPRGGSHLKPVLHKGKEAYTYIIGFEYQHKFYDYYVVRGSKNAIEIKNIKAYTFQ